MAAVLMLLEFPLLLYAVKLNVMLCFLLEWNRL